ncbi:MAG: sigma-70 family RNA polymerase sigma factor [Oscillospiraceae bacterium]|nr:sigma-70 family RNA polymerase sigma factor [Oscillospiraceae bacterium]
MNEAELIHKAQTGDVRAFEQLVEEYQQSVFNLAYRMIGNHEDAADMAQEAFIKAYFNLSKFKGNSKFSTWIYRIATNSCLDEIKKRKKTPTYSMSDSIEIEEGEITREIEDKSSNIEENFEREEQLKMVNKAIGRLQENHRIIIIMRDVNNMSYEEIAEILKCSTGTVKSRISRARTILHDFLKEDGLFKN